MKAVRTCAPWIGLVWLSSSCSAPGAPPTATARPVPAPHPSASAIAANETSGSVDAPRSAASSTRTPVRDVAAEATAVVPEAPNGPGCRLPAAQGTFSSVFIFVLEGRPFARIEEAKEVNQLYLDGSSTAFAAVDDGTLALAAPVETAALDFGAKEDTPPVDGWAYLRAGRATAVTDGRVTFRVRWPSGFTPAKDPDLTLGCDQLRLAPQSPIQPTRRTPDDRTVTVRADVAGDPIGRLEMHDGMLDTIIVLNTKGAASHVRLVHHTVWVEGWISTRDLEPAPSEPPGLGGSSGAALGTTSGWGWGAPGSSAPVSGTAFKCSKEVPLYVETPEGTYRVGRVHAERSVQAEANSDGDLVIKTLRRPRPHPGEAETAPPWPMYIAAADAGSCTSD